MAAEVSAVVVLPSFFQKGFDITHSGVWADDMAGLG
jgi:hypothetical protein